MLQLSQQLFQRIVEQGRAGKPLEVCGFLAGPATDEAGGGEVTHVTDIYPVDSDDRSELTYNMNPVQQLRAMREIRERGLEVVGIYHTHPATEPYPSKTDVARAHWGDTDDLTFPGYSYLIVSLRDVNRPEARSFKIQGRIIPQDILEETVEIT